MATVPVTASVNINALTYVSAADTLSLNNSVNGFVRLTIDAQVPADVTKIEAYLPNAISMSGVNAEVYVVNSTAVPLVVKFNGENSNTVNGPFSKFKVRGAWIDLQTGDGTNGQTIDFNTKCLTASGIKIDWPPFVQVEVAAGTGALIAVDPTAGATYQLGGAGTTYTVVSADITNGKGTLVVTGSAAPSANQGMLVKASGTGDANIGLRYWQKIGSQYVMHVGEAYVTMLNIGGTYNDITPTAYPFKRNFSDCGITIDNGHFFEWSEQNHTLYFGSALTGGWVPPNGANIRIPNIHFTGTAIPNANSANRIRFLSTSGIFDMEICSFSNRWSPAGSQVWPGGLRMRHVGALLGSSTITYLGPAVVDIDGCYNPLDLYQNTRGGLQISAAVGEFSVSDVVACSNNASPIYITGITRLKKAGIMRGTSFAKSSAYRYAVRFDDCASEVGYSGGQLTCGPIYCNGGSLYPPLLKNIRISGFFLSDTTTGVASATNTHAWITFMGGAEALTIDRWRVLDGGCPSNTFLIAAHTSPVGNVAIHDVVFDGKNPTTLADWQGGISSWPGGRAWIGNTDVSNFSGPILSATNGYVAKAPVRVIDALWEPTMAINAYSGLFIEGAQCTFNGLAGLVDVEPFHLLRSTGKTVGTLHFYPAVVNDQLDQISASGGTLGTEYFVTNVLNIPTTGLTLEYTGVSRIRGVLKTQASVAATFTGTAPTTGITHKIRFRKYGETTWPSYTTITSGTDFLTAWAAMQGYASYTPAIGFETQYQVVTTTSVAGRSITSVTFTLLDLDASWSAPEIGYVQAGFTGATEDANIAILDYTVPAAPVEVDYVTADATGAYEFEYPYNFDGAPVTVKVLGRKAGYTESFAVADVYQQGKSVPLALVASEACTDAAVSGIAFTGSTLSCSITLDATLADLYQGAQYQAHQSGSMIYPVPVTSNGVQGYTTVYDVTVATTKVLNGAGTLTLGAKTLSTEFASGVNYTYTGGAWSQLTTIPTFSGGTLNIGAAGTYTYTQAASMTVNVTPTAPGNYAFGDGAFTGTLTVNNATAHAVVVEVPSGTSTATSTPAVVTFSAPIVTADISITGMPNTTGANNRLQIINTTAITAPDWQAATVYAAGDIVLRTSGIGSENTAGLYMRCTTAGTSHATTEPTWDTTVGNTTADNTVVWTTYAVLYYDADPAATILTDTYIDGEEFLAGETVEIRFSEEDPAVSFKTYSTSVIATADGFSALVNEEDDPSYATYATSGVTQDSIFSPNFVANYIVLDTDTNFTASGAYAYYCYLLTTSDGMYRFWGGLTGIDPGNIRNNASVVSLYFDCSSGFVRQTDDIRIFRSDGLRPALDPVTAVGGGIEINWKVPVNVVTTGGSALTPTESAQLMALPSASITADAVWAKTLP